MILYPTYTFLQQLVAVAAAGREGVKFVEFYDKQAGVKPTKCVLCFSPRNPSVIPIHAFIPYLLNAL